MSLTFGFERQCMELKLDLNLLKALDGLELTILHLRVLGAQCVPSSGFIKVFEEKIALT